MEIKDIKESEDDKIRIRTEKMGKVVAVLEEELPIFITAFSFLPRVP